MRRRAGIAGFTLVELMLVMGMLALLAALAWPSYQAQVQRSRRVQARLLLLATAQQQERLLSARGEAGYSAKPWGERPVFSSDGAYRLEVRLGDEGRAYSLAAVPVAPAQLGDACGTLLLDDQGRQGLRDAAPGMQARDCWSR